MIEITKPMKVRTLGDKVTLAVIGPSGLSREYPHFELIILYEISMSIGPHSAFLPSTILSTPSLRSALILS